MRPIPRSHVQHPLDIVFGRVTNVRVLRALSEHGGALSAGQLAQRTGLSRSNVHQALRGLVAQGIVRSLGQGRSILYERAASHPFARQLAALFAAEAKRFDRVLEAIRDAAASHGPALLAVWLYGSVARGEDVEASDLDVAVVSEENKVELLVAALRNALAAVEAAEGVAISIVGLSQTDLLALPEVHPTFLERLRQDAIPLVGPAPESLMAKLTRAHRPGRRRRHG